MLQVESETCPSTLGAFDVRRAIPTLTIHGRCLRVSGLGIGRRGRAIARWRPGAQKFGVSD
jgi:hypothetical protein